MCSSALRSYRRAGYIKITVLLYGMFLMLPEIKHNLMRCDSMHHLVQF